MSEQKQEQENGPIQVNSAPVESFRSKYQAGLDCPRKRLFCYEWPNGTPTHGVVGKGFSRYLLLGSCLHEGLRLQMTKQAGVDEAVERVTREWDRAVAEQGLASPDGKAWVSEVLEFTMVQDRALLEGLVRLFGLRILPALEEDFEVLECEVDRKYTTPDGLISWIVKTDSLIRRKTTDEIYVMSFKGYAWWGEKQQRAAMVDCQNFGEPWGVEGLMAQWWSTCQEHKLIIHTDGTVRASEGRLEGSQFSVPSWFIRNGYAQWDEPPKITGVMMGVLKKGSEKEDKNLGLGMKVRYSPLIRGWWREGEVEIDTGVASGEWAWSWDTPKVNAKTGEEYMGILGKGWQKFGAWELPGGVKEWVERLAEGGVQPGLGDVLAQQYDFSEPYFKQDWAQERWAKQMVEGELRMAGLAECAREMIGKAESPEDLQRAMDFLDHEFPQNTRNCYDFNSRCQYFPVCFENPGLLVQMVEGDATAGGLLQARVSHHELEGGEE